MLRIAVVRLLPVLALAALADAQPVWAQQSSECEDVVRIENIRTTPAEYVNEVVYLCGVVEQYVEHEPDPPVTTEFYFLKDDWGALIQVRTSRGLPEVNEKYAVSGVVEAGEMGDVFLTEESRSMLVDPEPPPPPPPPWWQKWLPWLVIALAVVMLFVVVRRLRRPKAPAVSEPVLDVEPALGDTADEDPVGTLFGKTVKYYAPPEDTLRILPGLFELVSGDEEVKEVRFYKPEITFGRDAGPQYSHMHPDSPTVSRRQAKLIISDGRYTLLNFSTTNPTRVNAVELKEEGARVELQDGDRIDMGEVSFVFHAT